MNVKFYSAFFAFLLFTLLAVNVAALVPSESALQATQPYLRPGEEASVASRPYLVDGTSYWLVYFHPQANPQGKNIIIAVDAETGQPVTELEVLRKVYTFDYKLSFLQKFLSDNRLSFAEMRSTFESGSTKREQAATTLDALEDSLSREGKDITSVQNAFSIFTVSAERFHDSVTNGIDTSDLFEREYSSLSFDALVTSYRDTYSALVSFVRNGNDYQKAVVNKSNELTRQGVDPNKFRPQLQSAYDVGLEFPLLPTLEAAVADFFRINSTETQRAVNDSIQSYLYRKSKTDADSAVEAVRPRVEQVLQQKAAVNDCTSTTQLEKNWQAALAAQQRNNFQQVMGNATAVARELERVRKAVDACNAQTQPPVEQKQDNTTLYVAAVIVIALAYLGYTYYKKKKQAEEDEGDEKSKGKGKLFSG